MMNFFEKIFRKKDEKPVKRAGKRSFTAAKFSRYTDWILSSYTPINHDLKADLKELIIKARDLAKNNQLFRSYLTIMQKSIIGGEGFRLKVYNKDKNNELDKAVNDEIEWAWYRFGKRSTGFLSDSTLFGDKDFDKLVLRTFLVDGEVFIRVNRNANNPYGISFNIIDSLLIDTNKNHLRTGTQNAIVLGVEVDENNKPVQYWCREGNDDSYTAGRLYTIPASEVIHIYKSEFPGQTRGFSDIVASLNSLKQLDDFAIAELLAAKVGACLGVFYERNSMSEAGDFMTQEETSEKGEFISELSPGTASVVPTGYNVKSVAPTHPNSNFSGFVKAIVKRIAAALGLSYNRLSADYEAVNYSSLREAAIDEKKLIVNIQNFMIENWKQIEFEEWLKSYVVNYIDTRLSPVKLETYMNYQFLGRRDPLFDEAKEIIATERKLQLGLTDPLTELEERGIDPEQLLNKWDIWRQMCKDHKIDFSTDKALPLDVVNQFNDEANNISEDEENVNN